MRHDLRQEELARELRVVQQAGLPRRVGMRIRPAPQRQARLTCSRIALRSCHACSTHRGGPTVPVAAKHHQRRNRCCQARSAYDRQNSIECFDVRNGTTWSRGASGPRLMTRWRGCCLPRACRPRCRSGTRTSHRASGAADGVVGVDPRVHAGVPRPVRPAAGAARPTKTSRPEWSARTSGRSAGRRHSGSIAMRGRYACLA